MNFGTLLFLILSTFASAWGSDCRGPLSAVEEGDGLGVPLFYMSGRLRFVPNPSVLMDGTSLRPTTLGSQLRRVRGFLRNPELLKDSSAALGLSYDLITVSVALSWKARQSGSPELQRLAEAFEGLESMFNLACRQAAYLKYAGIRLAAWMPLPPMMEARPEQLSATLRMAQVRLQGVEFFAERARAAREDRP